MKDATRYFIMGLVAIVLGGGAYVIIRKEGIKTAAEKVLGKDYDQATVDAAMTKERNTTKQVELGDEGVFNDETGVYQGGSRKRRRTNSKRQSKKRNNKRSKSTKRRHHSRQISKKKK
jgi:hypothetical protein